MKKKIFLLIVILFVFCLTGCEEKEIEYEVKFIGFNNQLIETIKVLENQILEYPEVEEIEGYNFIKWDKEIKNVTENVVITAVYEIKTFIVKFRDNAGNVVKEEAVNYNAAATAPTLPEIETFEFTGWDKSFEHVKNDLDILPIYSKIKFMVSFHDELGDLLEEQFVEYGEDATSISAPNKEGYKFVRWDEDLTNVTKDLFVYPIYEKIRNEIYEVRFIDMYNNVIDIQNIKEGESANNPIAPEVSYHVFKGWDQDFSNVTKNMTIKAVYTKESNSYNNTNANYWLYLLSSNYDINKEILSHDEISDYNKKILSNYTATEVKDVLSLESTTTSTYVKGMIDQYTNINKYTIYNNETKTAITADEKQAILNNRNYSGLASNITLKYGIITDFAWLRSYPTNHYSNNYSMDRFQETSLNVGEAVAIYHTSIDNEWYFVQAENYNGWLEKKYVAECDYDSLVAFDKPEERVLVISDYVIIEGSHVRMGQTFPLVSETANEYTIKFPTRNADGTLNLKEISVEIKENYHKGYLTYNYYNVFTQAFKLLGIDYSWGDKDPLGRDCSSTMNAIYKCFGFMMPRNTTNQVGIPSYGSKVSGLTNISVQNYKPGSLIFTSSHVMLYLGTDANGIAYLLHNTTSGNGECILQSLNSYGGSRINGVLKLQ